MKKIKCKKCKGTGEIETREGRESLMDICDACGGKGYIDSEVGM